MIADWLAESMQEHEAKGEVNGLIRTLRHQVHKGILTVDQAKAEIREMVGMGEIPAETGAVALKQLG